MSLETRSQKQQQGQLLGFDEALERRRKLSANLNAAAGASGVAKKQIQILCPACKPGQWPKQNITSNVFKYSGRRQEEPRTRIFTGVENGTNIPYLHGYVEKLLLEDNVTTNMMQHKFSEGPLQVKTR